MKTKFKLLICLIITFVFLVPSIVLADSSTHFSLKVVKCDPSTYGNLTTKANLKACYTDYKAGKLSGYVVNSGDTLAASSYLLVMLDINPVSANNIESLQTRIYFDNTIFTPLTTSTGTFLYANDTTLFPANDDGDVLWNTTMSYVPASYPDRVTAIVSDGALTSGSPTAPLS